MSAFSSPPQTPRQEQDTVTFSSLSIESILRSFPRERLLVPPLHWTARQLELLSCTFLDSDSNSLPFPLSPHNEVHHRSDSAEPPSSSDSQVNSSTQGITDSSSSSPQRPDRASQSRLVRQVRTLACGQHPAFKEAAIEAILSASKIEQTRLPGRSARPSRAALALYLRRIAQLTPSNPRHEPYIAALLIATAQSQQRHLARVSHVPDKFPVRCPSGPINPLSSLLLLTHDPVDQVHVLLGDVKDKSYMTLYSADIPRVALERLSNLRKAPGLADPEIAIRLSDIPFQPYASFQERLVQAVIPQSSGLGNQT
ncbi:hypothetical protein CSUB01_11616 [Colletotrichum sublineola]|uniref:Uncharacterized protein n=1 Tax=Colletotrichum sublineola TaxID=1173701 RepID=A0A066XC52_COLSU|nr:hypothetical protein CSUB01_11616 [Colletotrichum sublineola]